jgi:integrase
MVFSIEATMANLKVRLMMRVKTDNGWQHYPAAYAANGRVKPGVSIVGGDEVRHLVGYYELRYYQGPKIIFESLANISPAEAEAKRKIKEAQLSVVVQAKKANIKVVAPDPKRRLLADALKQFLADTLDRGSTEAEEVYRFACEEFLSVIDHRYVDEIEPEDVLKFQRALRDRGLGKRTVSNRHNNVKAFLLYLGYDVKALPKPPKFDKTTPEIYTDRELNDLDKAVTDPRLSLLYRFLLQTGAREREAMHVEWSNIDRDAKTIEFKSKPKWKFRMKDFEERSVPISKELLDQLLAYKKDHAGSDTLIFAKGGRPDGHMLRTLKQQVRSAGLICKRCEKCTNEKVPVWFRECEKWYLHKFRATYCTKLLRPHRDNKTGKMVPGLDIVTVQKLMGHGELTSTMRYVRPAEAEQTQQVISRMTWM